MEYHVTWVIDLDGDSFEDGAWQAREIQLDPNSLATCFLVQDCNGLEREIWTEPKT